MECTILTERTLPRPNTGPVGSSIVTFILEDEA